MYDYDIKMIHDYLINNIEYETTIAKSNIYDIYGALVKNECVCEGYAEIFQIFIRPNEYTMYYCNRKSYKY